MGRQMPAIIVMLIRNVLIRSILVLVLIFILLLAGCSPEKTSEYPEEIIVEPIQKNSGPAENSPAKTEEITEKDEKEEAREKAEGVEEIAAETAKDVKSDMEKEDLGNTHTEIVEKATFTGDILEMEDSTEDHIVRSLTCSLSSKKLEFSIYNPTGRSLDPQPGGIFEDEANLMRISVNGRRYQGKCDAEELKAKSTMKCVSEFDPNDANSRIVLRTGTDKLGVPLHNRLLVKATGVNSVTIFRCIS